MPCLICVQVLLIVGVFASLNFFYDVTNSNLGQGLVHKSSSSEAFDLGRT
jgi:hypothetical protein